jgi:hypothetical protein
MSQTDVFHVRLNFGRARVVDFGREIPHVHRSVKMRMMAENGKYKPRVKFQVEPRYVE